MPGRLSRRKRRSVSQPRGPLDESRARVQETYRDFIDGKVNPAHAMHVITECISQVVGATAEEHATLLQDIVASSGRLHHGHISAWLAWATSLRSGACPCGSRRRTEECCYAHATAERAPRTLVAFSGPGTGLALEKCYAHQFRDCAPPITAEHFISKNVLKRIASGKAVQAIGWGHRSEPRPLRPSSLAANILCARHNNGLEPLDTIGGQFWDSLQTIAEAAYGNTLGQLEHRAAFFGPDIERWMVKALCGLLASGMASYLQEPFPRTLPPRDLLDVLFQNYDLPPPCGMVLVSTDQLGHDPVPGVAFRLASWGRGLGGLVLQWWSFAFVLIVRSPAAGPDIGLIRDGFYRPRQIWLPDAGNVRIDLDWPEPWNGPVATPRVHYRPRYAP